MLISDWMQAALKGTYTSTFNFLFLKEHLGGTSQCVYHRNALGNHVGKGSRGSMTGQKEKLNCDKL